MKVYPISVLELFAIAARDRRSLQDEEAKH
jgi:hypothetical protein